MVIQGMPTLSTNQGVGSSNLSERAKFKASSDGGLSFWTIQGHLDYSNASGNDFLDAFERLHHISFAPIDTLGSSRVSVSQ